MDHDYIFELPVRVEEEVVVEETGEEVVVEEAWEEVVRDMVEEETWRMRRQPLVSIYRYVKIIYEDFGTRRGYLGHG